MRTKVKVIRIKQPFAKGYSEAGASLTKRSLKGFTASSGSPIEDIDFNNSTLRQRGRMLYMASPVASAAVNTNRTKVVGPGLHMKSTINHNILGISDEAAKEWQQKTEAEWKLWCENKRSCDALGLNNFYEIQQLAMKSWLMSGDTFALIKRYDATPLNPYTLRLHIIEADRIRTPHDKGHVLNHIEGKNKTNGNLIHDGVEVNAQGQITAYHISSTYPNQAIYADTEWVRIEAYGQKTGLPNILHLMEAERPDQYRGVTFLAPIIEPLLQLRRYTEAELVAALVQSYLTAWITTDSDPTDFPLNEVGDGIEGESDTDDISVDENEYEMGPGQINHLNPGESVTLGNPNVPTAGFDNFVKAICRLCGAGIELPYDVLTKEFNSSYSAAKGALEEAWEAFKMRRSWFVTDFCQPTYEIWLAEAVAIGRIKAPGFFDNPLIRAAWSGARWEGPAQTHLDPKKEADANETAVKNGWKTNEQVTRENYGGDWEENAQILAREKATMKQIGGNSNGEKQDTDPETDPE